MASEMDTVVNSSETNAYLIYIPVGVFLIVCPFLVATRFWSRVKQGGRVGPDDYIILVSLMCSLASSAIMLASCHYGYGKHIVTLTGYERAEALKLFWACQITYKACINLTKISILLLYLRIFAAIRWFRWICIFMAIATAIYCVASIVATIVQCTPIAYAWDKTIQNGQVNVNNLQFWYANAGFSIATDVIILLLPMPLVYTLQIPRIQKVALAFVFMLGVFVVITSCLRVTSIDMQAKTTDKTYDIVSTMWTIIEMNVAIVCACLPQIRPLIVKLFPKLMSGSFSPRDRPSGKTPYDSAFSRGIRHSQANYVDNDWEHGDCKDGFNMTNIRKGDAGSEEYILHEDKSLQIQKTVGYSIEFSKDSPSKYSGQEDA
ncbi:uncharacterized protein BCR38DRAFT_498924 [Pseudomassariella vexata]|uniref:Rhodopsin domain-containing protein n=1 Tax=Pseudomassariella vexata TaxID=1141098 RepID=A0A1Y2DK93_9PEZI|nr:uncharacterized protein BCR38DRAFT_498924 [Pseudomassariella vexata]ORY59185.1 hypothetical protein BCR38DRAFT_498924 [Pseudomassariella vexata]